MKNILENVAGIGIAILILAAIGGYYYLSADSYSQDAFLAVAADKKYLQNNQQKYADCYYTVKGNFELITPTVVNRFYNQGAPKAELTALEKKFLAKYEAQCKPIMSGYESKFSEYKSDQLALAKSRLTNFDKLTNKTPVVESQPSPILSLYEEYDPKSLQYPTNSSVNMLYSSNDFANYLNENL